MQVRSNHNYSCQVLFDKKLLLIICLQNYSKFLPGAHCIPRPVASAASVIGWETRPVLILATGRGFAMRPRSETALCRSNCIHSTQLRAGYGALSAGLFAIFKVIFTNNEAFLFNKNRCAKVCRTLLMHWFVHFFLKRLSSWCANSCQFFQCSDRRKCMGMEW